MNLLKDVIIGFVVGIILVVLLVALFALTGDPLSNII